MLTTDDPGTDIEITDDAVSNLETRYSIVRDALVNDRSHADESIDQFLNVLYDSLADYPVAGNDNEPLDQRVVNTLDDMKSLSDYFLEFVKLAVEQQRGAVVHQKIRSFLGRSLAYKHAPRDIIHFNHLWCDQYRFLLRELFIGVIGLLVANRQYDEVNSYLIAEYLFETNRGPQTANFLRFDSYVKSLDEFRVRRMRKSRLSVTADLQRDRCNPVLLTFDQIMQTDFILCIRGLLHHPNASTRWFPRTLVYAQPFEKTGFDLFFSAQSRQEFKSVCKVLGIRDKADLVERFTGISEQCALSEWNFGGIPIPFEKYLGLNSLATT